MHTDAPDIRQLLLCQINSRLLRVGIQCGLPQIDNLRVWRCHEYVSDVRANLRSRKILPIRSKKVRGYGIFAGSEQVGISNIGCRKRISIGKRRKSDCENGGEAYEHE